MSDIGDLMYRLGYNTVDRFGRKSSEEDRALLREKDKQKAAIEEQNKARIAQMLIENQAYADRQKAQIAAQQGMAREGQEFDMTRDMLNAAEAANRQQAGFKQQRDISIDEEIAAGERALMMRDLQKAALRENPRLIAEGENDAAEVAGSRAALEKMTRGYQGQLAPEQHKQDMLMLGIRNDPNNKPWLENSMLGQKLGDGDAYVGKNFSLVGPTRSTGLVRGPDGNLMQGTTWSPPALLPNLSEADLKKRAEEIAAKKKTDDNLEQAKRWLKATTPKGPVMENNILFPFMRSEKQRSSGNNVLLPFLRNE